MAPSNQNDGAKTGDTPTIYEVSSLNVTNSKLQAAATRAAVDAENRKATEASARFSALVKPKNKFKAAALAIAQSNEGEDTDDNDEADDKVSSLPSELPADRKEAAEDNWAKVGYKAKVTALAAKAQRASTNSRLFSRAVVSANTWDVWTPPPGNSLSGKVIPRLMNKHKSRRKCSLEIHRVTPTVNENSKDPKAKAASPRPQSHSYHECVVRILVPASKDLDRKIKYDALKNLANNSTEGSLETFTSVRQIRFDDYDDDSTVSSTSKGSGSNAIQYPEMADYGGKEYEGWKPRYSIPMHGIYVRGRSKKTVTILISLNDFKQERDLIFDTPEDARSFEKLIEKQQRLEAVRQDDRLKYALGDDVVLPKYENITLLLEIVAAYDLPVGDYITSDPYVCAYMGHQEIHRTSHCPRTLNPIWTLKTKSLFLLNVESKRFFIEEGLKFIVKDYDKLGKDEILGICKVEPKVLYQANGERMEFKIIPPRIANAGRRDSKTEPNTDGVLVIRCRRASPYDQKFMTDYAKHEDKKIKGVASYNGPKADTNAFKTLTTRVKKRDPDSGETLYKIRPNPDPKRPPNETEWMTKMAIREAVIEPSHHWVDMGEGHLGKIYLEILGCDGLPNLDTGGFYGNKSDVFVGIVYEDVYGRTDVIDDCLNPRWLPWSNRAFILNIAHPSSFLNIGVFDFDSGTELLSNHDLIGRVSVDLTNLRSATEYVLSYNIYPSARVPDRKSYGKIMIRLRMEVPDERALTMAALYPPPPTYVNCKEKKDFDVIRKTCFGNIDEDRYSTSTLKAFIDELYELQNVSFYISDGIYGLLLWRSLMPFTIPYTGIKLKLPVNSMSAFVSAIFLVEHPTFIPSFCFGTIGWLMLAIGIKRQEAENPWWRCHSYVQIFKMIAFGDDFAEAHKVAPFENYEASKKEAQEWVERIEESEKVAARNLEEANAAEQERLRELAEIGELDNDLSTKVGSGGIAIDPIRAALYPVQLMLGIYVRMIRVVKNIFMWNEAYISFWVTSASLALATISLFIPWLWCLKWGSRVVAWGLFGPWMKLADIYYFSLIKPETEEDRKRRQQAEKLARKLTHYDAIVQARIERENIAKSKAMKKYLFGRFALRIPILKYDRYADIPLAESWAIPYKEKKLTLAELAMQEAGYNRKRIPGQTLLGDMIPHIKEEDFTQAPTGKATLHTEKLSKDAPGSRGGKLMNPITIVVALGVAIVITYYGTPIFANVVVECQKWIASVSSSTPEL